MTPSAQQQFTLAGCVLSLLALLSPRGCQAWISSSSLARRHGVASPFHHGSSTTTQLNMFDFFNKKDDKKKDQAANDFFNFFQPPTPPKPKQEEAAPESVATTETEDEKVKELVLEALSTEEPEHVVEKESDDKAKELVLEALSKEDEPVVVEKAESEDKVAGLVQEALSAEEPELVVVPSDPTAGEEAKVEAVVEETKVEPVEAAEEPAVAVQAASHDTNTSSSQSDVHSGKVRWFSRKRGYGFIDPLNEAEESVFVHHSEIQATGYKCLYAGELVDYAIKQDDQGRLLAQHVTGPEGGELKITMDRRKKKEAMAEAE
eukprot:CAMPEP_0168843558 /NCGR_PEP_ID=MMETSP0727-20121128/8278_1 /TAXON_ID=265536 /ORGANISM="Amphiprora sp., Strain CCMP467" /LENGTH=318 /DNA_ID=CAMNT_0008897163 /DNA_START=104 /DNA_END=1060 /DNA_ORIENTATION=+